MSESSSGSESEDIENTGLIATRAKRATAGNLYATLRANLDDEELQKELLAEDEGDAGEYEGSDKDDGDDDDALDSSSDDEDAGPPAEGTVEDLDGEKALKKQERVEAAKKRKAQDAKLKLPAWQKKIKRVKLADDVKTEDGSTSERPKKKKSERANWLPSAADAPMRQSRRALAVANREVIHANLKQSAERSERQRRVMKVAAERDNTKKRMTELTREERLKKCERIEKETGRELGRFEREEAERQRLREEALMAKRRKGVNGPVVRTWSGSVLWEGDKIKLKKVEHGSMLAQEIEEVGKKAETEGVKVSDGSANSLLSASVGTASTPSAGPVPTTQSGAIPISAPETTVQPPVPWLQGIQEYAAQPEPTPSHPPSDGYTPSTPSIHVPQSQQVSPQTYPPPSHHPQLSQPWPAGLHQFTVQQPPPPPAPPLIREQAQRSLLILEKFPSLETPPPTTTKRAYKTAATAAKANTDTSHLDPTPLSTLLLPSSHPSFSSAERSYLTTRPRRPKNTSETPLPAPPPKQRCAVTSWPAKFRDPKTGLAYADLHQYKVIQRVLAGGCWWSGLVGAWVGPKYGAMGRPARGTPEGFANAIAENSVEEVKKEEVGS